MRLAKTILYVEDAEQSVRFMERAFGLTARVSMGADYGELDTGDTALAFASYSTGERHLPDGLAAGPSAAMSCEVALTVDDVPAAFRQAVAAGATPLQEPEEMPWGQVVSHLRCPDGTFVDLSSPAAS